MHFPAYSLGTVDAMLKFWKDATVISLVNYRKFQSIAWKKKGTGNIKNANECVESIIYLKGLVGQVGKNSRRLVITLLIWINDIRQIYYLK